MNGSAGLTIARCTPAPRPTAIRRRARGPLAAVILAATLGAAGCAGQRPSESVPVFPPHPWRPLRVAIAPPHAALDLGPLHESLASWSDRPSERRRLVSCTWQEGVPTLAGLAWPATELSAVVLGRWPLGQTGHWCEFAGDGPDSLLCRLTAQRPLDFARRSGLSHLVVPRALVYGIAAAGTDSTLLLTTDLAVIDVIERDVVWTGRVAARTADVGRFRSIDPDLTSFERATYAWLVELARVFDRIETWPARETGLHELALGCHDPSPVFDPPTTAAVATPEAADPTARDAEASAPGPQPTDSGEPR